MSRLPLVEPTAAPQAVAKLLAETERRLGVVPNMFRAMAATGNNPKTTALLAFATAVNDGRGEVSDAQFAAARAAGLTDHELAETIAHVALNVLTNYFNKAVEVDVDFPVIAA